MKFFLIIFTLFAQSLLADNMKELSFLYDNIDRYYLLNLPENHNKDKPINLVIGLHGYTGTASGFEKETTGGFNKSSNKYNFIAAYPQGTYFNDADAGFVSSWNDLAGSESIQGNSEICLATASVYPKYANCDPSKRCAWTSCGDDLGFIMSVINKIKNNYLIDKVYIVGMSNGGMMAQAFACKYPDVISGVINVVGMQHYGFSCIPDKPVNFVIYGGLKDTTVPPLKIEANDGYLYEPLMKTFNQWSNSFNCKNLLEEITETSDDIQMYTFTDCDGGVNVTALLNPLRAHLWPGITNSVGFCSTKVQINLDLDKQKNLPDCMDVNNSWGNDYLLEKILK